jgi:hypothetical protein
MNIHAVGRAGRRAAFGAMHPAYALASNCWAPTLNTGTFRLGLATRRKLHGVIKRFQLPPPGRHVTDDCLTAFVNMNMFDFDLLLSAVAHFVERLHLSGCRSHHLRHHSLELL